MSIYLITDSNVIKKKYSILPLRKAAALPSASESVCSDHYSNLEYITNLALVRVFSLFTGDFFLDFFSSIISSKVGGISF